MNCKLLMICVISAGMCAYAQSTTPKQTPSQTNTIQTAAPAPQNKLTNSTGPAAQPGAMGLPETTKLPAANIGAQTTPPPTQTQSAEEERGASALPESDIENPEINDVSNLRSEIQGALAHEPTLENAQVNVGVKDNDIELTGTVPNAKTLETAKRIAESYAINERVIDHMKVANAIEPTQTKPKKQ